MRTYNVLVNADLVDILDPNIIEWNNLHKNIHTLLEIQYMCEVTGCIESRVSSRPLWTYKEFL